MHGNVISDSHIATLVLFVGVLVVAFCRDFRAVRRTSLADVHLQQSLCVHPRATLVDSRTACRTKSTAHPCSCGRFNCGHVTIHTCSDEDNERFAVHCEQ